MAIIDKISIDITINGTNVSGDIAPYIAKVTYTDKEEGESDDVSVVVEDTAGRWVSAWYPTQGDTLVIRMGTPADMLNCGVFEIDEIEFDTPPDTFTFKGIATVIGKELRTRNSHAFEFQTLREVAQFFAKKHSLKLVCALGELDNLSLPRVTQDRQTDIEFLAKLAKDYGVIFSIKGENLIFTHPDTLTSRGTIATIDKGAVSKARFRDKTSQVYAAATVTSRSARQNKVKKWDIKAGQNGSKDMLIINTPAATDAVASAKAKGGLSETNKDKITGSVTVPGRSTLVAGVNIELTGFGNFSGLWHVTQASHTVDPSTGWVTDLSIRKL